MGIDSYARDPYDDTPARVFDGAQQFIEAPIPPFGAPSKMRVFRQYLTADGTAAGSNDMKVDGSSTSVEFWVPASSTKDRYITTLSFVISDALAALNSFGTLSALTNGCDLEYVDEEGTVTIHGELKSNFDFVRLCSGNPAFGDGNTAFRGNNISGSSEGFLPVLDLRATFGFKWGVRLAVGTEQKLILRVNDDTTGVDSFDCIAYGFERAK